MPVQQLRQPAQRHRLGDAALPQLRVYPLPVEHLVQVLPDGLFHKQRLRVLGQRPDASRPLHLAPLGRQRPGQKVQAGGLARAVAAQQRHELAPTHGNVQSLYHVRQSRLIAEEQPPPLQHRLAPGGARLLRQRPQHVVLVPYLQEIPALPHGDRAGRVAADAGPHPHGGGHGQKHPVATVTELPPHLRRRAGTQQPAAVQHRRVRGQGQRLLQPVLRQDHRRAQLPVDAAQRLQELRRRDGVKLAGGLVQNQHLGLQNHDRRQTQQLLLPAGQLIHVLVKPVLNTKKRRHLCHPAADGRRVKAQTLHAEGQLVPHLVRHHLVLRRLQYKPDLRRLPPVGHILQRHTLKEDTALRRAVGRQHRLALAQQRGLAAARRAAQHPKLPQAHGQRYVVQRPAALLGIGEAEMLQPKHLVHTVRPPFSRLRKRWPDTSESPTGVRHSSRYTAKKLTVMAWGCAPISMG